VVLESKRKTMNIQIKDIKNRALVETVIFLAAILVISGSNIKSAFADVVVNDVLTTKGQKRRGLD
jgi:hypothetical protein